MRSGPPAISRRDVNGSQRPVGRHLHDEVEHMGAHRLPGNPPIARDLRRSARARRITLRVSARGRAGDADPAPRAARGARRWLCLHEKEAWLRGHLARPRAGVRGRRPVPRFRSRACRSEIVAGRRASASRRSEGALLVPGEPARAGVHGCRPGSRRWRATGWPRPRTGMRRRSAAAIRGSRCATRARAGGRARPRGRSCIPGG